MTVIGAEILAPFRRTMRLVENPTPISPLRQYLARCDCASARGDEQDSDVARRTLDTSWRVRASSRPLIAAVVDTALAQALT